MDPTWSSNCMTLAWTISSVKCETALEMESSSLARVELTYQRASLNDIFPVFREKFTKCNEHIRACLNPLSKEFSKKMCQYRYKNLSVYNYLSYFFNFTVLLSQHPPLPLCWVTRRCALRTNFQAFATDEPEMDLTSHGVQGERQNVAKRRGTVFFSKPATHVTHLYSIPPWIKVSCGLDFN
jgi:hypothetical protein